MDYNVNTIPNCKTILLCLVISAILVFLAPTVNLAQDTDESYLIDKVEIQGEGKKLTEEELKIFKEETRKKIDQLQGQFSKIASRKESAAVKKIYKKSTLKLFINNGKRVTIEVSSVNSTSKREYEIPYYLDKLANMTRYAEVIMKRSDACYLSDFREAGLDDKGNQTYEATATIYQEFIGKDENGNIIYRDITTKTFAITLKLVPTVLDESGYRWAALLGDIKVAGTIP